ncbi:MAG: hypothetical protein GF409_02765 [Candidatus Omnitrophica bacterium]|nr:hypothetical protein [Candidatus Omnitrophota bacterium]
MKEGGYLKSTIQDYLEKLSGRVKVPGGGSSAALTAAVGAGLNLMVINYSDKEQQGDTEGMDAARQRQQESLDRLSEMVDKDCEVFAELMAKLSAKQDAQSEFAAAAKVPMDICREAHISMDISSYLSDNGNPRLISDVGCSAQFLKSAFYAAQINVRVNLKYITDIAFCENAEKALATMRKDIDTLCAKIDRQVNDKINPEGI